jgi:hypothetical protein
MAFVIITRWALSPNWGPRHKWIITFAATVASMSGGFLGSSAWSRVDVIGKWVLNVLAAAAFVGLYTMIRNDNTERRQMSPAHRV